MPSDPGLRRATASAQLRVAKRDLQQAGGQFAQPRYWLVRYLWQETEATARRRRRVHGPMRGLATAIGRAVNEHEVWTKLQAQLEVIGHLLLEVVFAEPWGDAGTMVLL
jgi:hypothetical protein